MSRKKIIIGVICACMLIVAAFLIYNIYFGDSKKERESGGSNGIEAVSETFGKAEEQVRYSAYAYEKEQTGAAAEEEEEKETVGAQGSGQEVHNSGSSGASSRPQQEDREEEAATEPPKTPKPAKYSVIKANDFPNDFPRDWSYRYSEFCWYISYIEWGYDYETEKDVPIDVRWSVSPDSGKVVGAIDNARPYLPPAPSLKETIRILEEEGVDSNSDERITYGHTHLYVCLED